MVARTRDNEDFYLSCPMDESHLSAVNGFMVDGLPTNMFLLRCDVCGSQAVVRIRDQEFRVAHAPCCPHCNPRNSEVSYHLPSAASGYGEPSMKCTLDGSHSSAIRIVSRIDLMDSHGNGWVLHCEVCDSNALVMSDWYDGYVEAHESCCAHCNGPGSLNMLRGQGVQLIRTATATRRFHQDTDCSACRTTADQRFEEFKEAYFQRHGYD